MIDSAATNPDIDVIRRPSARRMKLSLDPRSGRLRLVLPKRAALGAALDWVKDQQGWIDRQRAQQPAPWPITPGMAIPFAGRSLTLDWSIAYARNPKLVGERIEIGGPVDLMPSRLVRWLKREALALLHRESQEFAARCGVTIGKIGIGDPRTRWGSCAPGGDIRYSWRLILAPSDVRRATVAHEIAHRVHMDHSPAFHAKLKEIADDDPRKSRLWLRANGTRLHMFGREERPAPQS